MTRRAAVIDVALLAAIGVGLWLWRARTPETPPPRQGRTWYFDGPRPMLAPGDSTILCVRDREGRLESRGLIVRRDSAGAWSTHWSAPEAGECYDVRRGPSRRA